MNIEFDNIIKDLFHLEKISKFRRASIAQKLRKNTLKYILNKNIQNDKVIDKGDLWPMDGGPLSSLNWLQKHLREHDLKLSAGDVVLVGTALGLYSVRSGDKIDVKVDGKSAVHCTVDTSLEINY